MKKTFRCDCEGHIISINYDKATEGFGAMLSFEIRETMGKVKKLKRPRWMADVVIYNNEYPKEMDKLINFLEKIVKKYRQEKK